MMQGMIFQTAKQYYCHKEQDEKGKGKRKGKEKGRKSLN